jgi:hypothetical protein
MAEIPDGPYGAMRGRAGNLVGYVLNGKNFLRVKPGKRTGVTSEAELANRDKFRKAQNFAKPLLEFVKVGFKDYGTATGGFKAAVSSVRLNAIEGEYPNQFVNPALVKVSGGNLAAPETAEASLDENNVLRFTWSKKGGLAYDQAMLLAYDPEIEKAFMQTAAGFRKDGTDTLQLFPMHKDAKYHIYLGFVAKDRSRQAHSIYLGTVEIPKK